VSFRGVRDALRSIIPNWLADRLSNNTGYKVLYTIALLADGIIEVALQGLNAAWPGAGTPTALPLIGQSRGIIRGSGESDAAYEARLQQWNTLWQNAGADETLAQLIQTYLGNNLVVRVISRSGTFVTANADGTTTKAIDTSWNWDTAYNPERAPWWSDIWVVVYLDTRWPRYTYLSDTAWRSAWGTRQGFGIGHQVPRDAVDDVLNIVATFKGAHTWVEAIIWTTDTALFVPGSLGVGGNPTEYWGGFGADTGASEVPARTDNSTGGYTRYWIPAKGG